MKKINPVVVILILAALFVVGTRFINAPKNPPKAQASQKTLTGLEIAKQTFTFLDKTIKQKGGFYGSFECNKNFEPVCRPKEFYEAGHAYFKPPPHFGHLTLAFYDYGKKTGEQSYIDKASKAVDFAIASCETDDAWCLWNFSPLIVFNNDFKDEKYANAMLRVGEQMLVDKSPMELLALNSGLKLKALYDITKDARYLNTLTSQADAIVGGVLDKEETNPVLYKDGDFTLRAQTLKAVWSAIIPAYAETKDEKYLKYANDVYNGANLPAHMGKFQTADEFQHLVFALDSSLQLANLDPANKEAHMKRAHEIAQHLYATYADTPENMQFNGDYGFVDNGMKDSLNNGWIVRDFVKLADDKFTSK